VEKTPDPMATAFVTPTPKTEEERAYDSAKAKAKDLTFSKSYQDAIPVLRDCIKKRPDDWECQFLLLLSIGCTEPEPSPKSEAYTIGKLILDKASTSPFAERAFDYVVSADSEPPKPLPDLEGETIPARGDGGSDLYTMPDAQTAYTIEEPINLLLSNDIALTPDLKKTLWYLEVQPTRVPADSRKALKKGTSFAVQEWKHYFFSKNSWRGGGAKAERDISENPDKNSYHLIAYRIQVQDGPNKGAKGWYVNQMDRFKALDENGKPVWGIKVAPRLLLEAKNQTK
jgi:hypothetical protein